MSLAVRTVRLVAVVAALAAAVPPAAADARKHPPSSGLRAVPYTVAPPDFAFAYDGATASLRALVGRPVVLNFWASWCEPCRAELPAFERLRATYGEHVPVVTISDEAPGAARAYLAERGLDLPVVEDPARAIFTSYGIVPIPVTIVIAPDGTATHVSIGELDWSELQSAVAATGADLTAPVARGSLRGNAGTPAS